MMYNTVTIPRGGEYRLELSDGTKVWLNAETELRFPVSFSGNTRDVYLKGEAYFEVKKDADCPFLVHSSMGCVKVLGTSFNVRYYADEREVVTTLESGKVMYFSDDLSKTVVLSPGQQAVDKEGDSLELKAVSYTHLDVYKRQLSDSIMTSFLLQRSTSIPENNPSTACGSRAAIVANASVSADLVSKVSHSMIAKLTSELVSIEKNCPVHIIANTFFQLFMVVLCEF